MDKVNQLQRVFVEKYDPASLNVDRIAIESADEGEREKFLALTMAQPFMAEKRLIVARGLLMAVDKKSLGTWSDAVERLPDSTVLILMEELSEKELAKSALYPVIQKEETKIYPISDLSENEAIKYVEDLAHSWGAKIDKGVARAIVKLAGQDSIALQAALRPVAAAANYSMIKLDQVSKFGRLEEEFGDFAFVDALIKRNNKLVWQTLDQKRREGEDSFMTLGSIAREVKIAKTVGYLKKSGERINASDLAKVMQIHPYVATKALGVSSGGMGDDRIFSLARSVDRLLKLGLDPALGVDYLIASWLVLDAK